MTDQSGFGATGLERLFQGLAHQALAQVIGHRVADDPAAVEVFEAGQIQPTLIGGDIRDVARPDLIGSRHPKSLGQHILGDRQVMARIGGGPKPSFLPAAQAQLAAGALDAMYAHTDAMRRQIALETFGAVRRVRS